MANPIIIGTTAIVVASINKRRVDIRFQNVGTTTIYIKKIPISGAYSIVSTSDFEVKLLPGSTDAESGEAFDTNSIASFMAVSSAANGSLAIYETHKV